MKRLQEYLPCLICCGLALLSSLSLAAQPDSLWSVALYGEKGSFFSSLVEGTDGSVYWEGTTDSQTGDFTGNNKGEDGIYLVKVSPSGEKVWINTFNDGYREIIGSLAAAPDGGVILTGWRQVEENQKDLWVAWYDPDGRLVWERTFGGPQDDTGSSVFFSDNGQIIITGGTEGSGGDVSNHYGDRDVWLVALDLNGNLRWERTIGGSGTDLGRHLIEYRQGYILVGSSDSPDGHISAPRGDFDIWLVELDGEGQYMRDYSFGGSGVDAGLRLIPIDGGGFMLAGNTTSQDQQVFHHKGGYFNIWVAELGSDFSLEWSRAFGGSRGATGIGMFQTIANTFIVGSRSLSQDGDITSDPPENNPFLYGGGWLFEFGDYGEILWDVKFAVGDLGNNGFIHDIAPASDGGFYIGRERLNVLEGTFNDYFHAWLTKFGPPFPKYREQTVCPDWLLYPNPLTGRQVQLRWPEALTFDGEIRVIDVLGRIVHRQDIYFGGLEGQFELPAFLPAGQYVVQLRSEGKVCQEPLIIAE
ncbi:MAG: T9SS type A sorting domain-containing protein [Phaeodactylibacter sp.]|uniref:T9SS type A sorting domain-containing protein n=1 Tax=Phaeodactylibacter sp. TaxID=1940289 RepID=UPI0032ECED79